MWMCRLLAWKVCLTDWVGVGRGCLGKAIEVQYWLVR
jgi:hypothetical protein